MFRRGTDGGQLLMSWTGASVEKFETNARASFALLLLSLTERTCVLCTLAACQHVTCAD